MYPHAARSARPLLFLTLLLAFLTPSNSSSADTVTAESTALAIQGHLTLTTAGLPATATFDSTSRSGTASPDYFESLPPNPFTFQNSAVAYLHATDVSVNVAGFVSDDIPNSGSASAGASLSFLDLYLLPGPNPFLRLTADRITSSSFVGGEPDSYFAIPGSSVTNLTLTLAGNTLYSGSTSAFNTLIPVPTHPGLTIRLNERTTTGDGSTSRGLSVNAVHLLFDNVQVSPNQTLTGEILLAHTEAEISTVSAVPLPSAASAGALLLLPLLTRRRPHAHCA